VVSSALLPIDWKMQGEKALQMYAPESSRIVFYGQAALLHLIEPLGDQVGNRTDIHSTLRRGGVLHVIYDELA